MTDYVMLRGSQAHVLHQLRIFDGYMRRNNSRLDDKKKISQ